MPCTLQFQLLLTVGLFSSAWPLITINVSSLASLSSSCSQRCVTDTCHPRVLRRTTPKTAAMAQALGTRINHPSRVCIAPDTLA